MDKSVAHEALSSSKVPNDWAEDPINIEMFPYVIKTRNKIIFGFKIFRVENVATSLFQMADEQRTTTVLGLKK